MSNETASSEAVDEEGMSEQPGEFESVKNRLAEIAEAVDDETLPLDAALDLYEEAVALGLQASDLLETGVVPPEPEEEPAEQENAEGHPPMPAEQESAEDNAPMSS